MCRLVCVCCICALWAIVPLATDDAFRGTFTGNVFCEMRLGPTCDARVRIPHLATGDSVCQKYKCINCVIGFYFYHCFIGLEIRFYTLNFVTTRYKI